LEHKGKRIISYGKELLTEGLYAEYRSDIILDVCRKCKFSVVGFLIFIS